MNKKRRTTNKIRTSISMMLTLVLILGLAPIGLNALMYGEADDFAVTSDGSHYEEVELPNGEENDGNYPNDNSEQESDVETPSEPTPEEPEEDAELPNGENDEEEVELPNDENSNNDHIATPYETRVKAVGKMYELMQDGGYIGFASTGHYLWTPEGSQATIRYVPPTHAVNTNPNATIGFGTLITQNIHVFNYVDVISPDTLVYNIPSLPQGWQLKIFRLTFSIDYDSGINTIFQPFIDREDPSNNAGIGPSGDEMWFNESQIFLRLRHPFADDINNVTAQWDPQPSFMFGIEPSPPTIDKSVQIMPPATDAVSVGDRVQYTITIENPAVYINQANGSSLNSAAFNNFRVEDVLPAGLELDLSSIAISGARNTPANNSFDNTVDITMDLHPAATNGTPSEVVITFEATVMDVDLATMGYFNNVATLYNNYRGSTTTDNARVPVATPTLTGSVTCDYSGRRIPGVTVWLYRDDNGTWVRDRHLVTDSNGFFDFETIPPGQNRVYTDRATIPPGYSVHGDFDRTFTASQNGAYYVPFYIIPYPTLDGTITYYGTNRPIVGVRVMLYRLGDDGVTWVFYREETTNQNGEFDFGAIPPNERLRVVYILLNGYSAVDGLVRYVDSGQNGHYDRHFQVITPIDGDNNNNNNNNYNNNNYNIYSNSNNSNDNNSNNSSDNNSNNSNDNNSNNSNDNNSNNDTPQPGAQGPQGPPGEPGPSGTQVLGEGSPQTGDDRTTTLFAIMISIGMILVATPCVLAFRRKRAKHK